MLFRSTNTFLVVNPACGATTMPVKLSSISNASLEESPIWSSGLIRCPHDGCWLRCALGGGERLLEEGLTEGDGGVPRGVEKQHVR